MLRTLFLMIILLSASHVKAQDFVTYRNFAQRDTVGVTHCLREYVVPGRCVLVDFWASWCAPCRRSARVLRRVYDDYHERNFDIVSVSLDTDSTAWREAIRTLRMPWTQLSDLRGWRNSAARAYGIESVPYAIFIDARGTVLFSGNITDGFEPLLRELIEGAN